MKKISSFYKVISQCEMYGQTYFMTVSLMYCVCVDKVLVDGYWLVEVSWCVCVHVALEIALNHEKQDASIFIPIEGIQNLISHICTIFCECKVFMGYKVISR